MRHCLLYSAGAVLGFLLALGIVTISYACEIYGFNDAEITMITTTPMSTITKHTTVGDSGCYEREDETTKIDAFGMKRTETQTRYTDRKTNILYTHKGGDEYTAIDMSTMIHGAKQQGMYMRHGKVTEEAVQKFNGRILRKETIHGLKTVVVEYPDFMSTVWLYEGFAVKMVSNAAGMEVISDLVRFKKGADRDFKLPRTAQVGKTQKIDELLNRRGPSASEDTGEGRDYVTEQDMHDHQEKAREARKKMQNEMPNLQDALKDGGPEMENAMKALQEMFSTQK